MAITSASQGSVSAALGNSVSVFAAQGTTIFFANYRPGLRGSGNPWDQLFADRMSDWNGLPGPTKTFYSAGGGFPNFGTTQWGANELPRKRGGYPPYTGTAQPPMFKDYSLSIGVTNAGTAINVEIIPFDSFDFPWQWTMLVSDSSSADDVHLDATLRYLTTGTFTAQVPIEVQYTPPSGSTAGRWVFIRCWAWDPNQFRTDRSEYRNQIM